MKQTITSASIIKFGKDFLLTIKMGRKSQAFNFPTKNAARSFVRRNYTGNSSYN